jgi:hypothetical protein
MREVPLQRRRRHRALLRLRDVEWDKLTHLKLQTLKPGDHFIGSKGG